MSKINVTYKDPITKTSPILNRYYTLTHSDETGDLFLTIGPKYDDSISESLLKDAVFGKWVVNCINCHILMLFVDVGYDSYEICKKRYNTFKTHLPHAISGIIKGDIDFLNTNKTLLDSKIYLKFNCKYDEFNNFDDYGYIKKYT